MDDAASSPAGSGQQRGNLWHHVTHRAVLLFVCAVLIVAAEEISLHVDRQQRSARRFETVLALVAALHFQRLGGTSPLGGRRLSLRHALKLTHCTSLVKRIGLHHTQHGVER
jgi:hypothetical protein